MKKRILSMVVCSVVVAVSQSTSLTALASIDFETDPNAEVAVTAIEDTTPRMDFDFETLVKDTTKSITRAGLVEMLYRLAGAPDIAKMPEFKDVSQTASYAKAVAWAKEAGIAAGYLDGTFAPERAITNQELSTMLYNYADVNGYGFKGEWLFLLEANDRESIAGWAYTGACWLSMNEIVMFSEDNNFEPKREVTGEEAIAIMARFTEHLNQIETTQETASE